MKNTIFAALICTSSLTAPAFAQATPEATKEKPAEVAATTNELALAAINDFKAIIKIAGTADNLENANKAATAIKGLLEKFPAHTKALKAAKAPTEAEKKELAIAMLDADEEMNAAVKKMQTTLGTADEDTQKVMGPLMQSVFLNIGPFMEAVETLYPKDEMDVFENAEKERREKAAAPKKAEEKK